MWRDIHTRHKLPATATLFAAILLALSGCATPPPQTCVFAPINLLNVHFANGQLNTGVLINTKPANFIIDTGADYTLLTTTAANRLNLPNTLIPGATADVIGGAQHISRTQIGELIIGSAVLRNRALPVIDSPMPTAIADGSLGMDFLSNFDVDFDLANNAVNLYHAYPGCADIDSRLSLSQPLYGVDLIAVPNHATIRRFAVTIGGQTFMAQFDSGSSVSVIFRDAAARLGMTDLAFIHLRNNTARGFGTALVPAAYLSLNTITIGALTLNHMPIEVVDQDKKSGPDILIGLDFATKVHVWMKQSGHKLLFQFPPLPTPPLPAPHIIHLTGNAPATNPIASTNASDPSA